MGRKRKDNDGPKATITLQTTESMRQKFSMCCAIMGKTKCLMFQEMLLQWLEEHPEVKNSLPQFEALRRDATCAT